MTDCSRMAEWETSTEELYMESYTCTEHLSKMVADDTIIIREYKEGNQVCCYTGIHYDTIDGKWWEFEDEKAIRPLTDDEAASVIWGSTAKDRRECLADLCHRQWSGWMEYLFSKGTFSLAGTWTMPRWAVERWKRQMTTPYADLSPEEQDNDRQEADRFIGL